MTDHDKNTPRRLEVNLVSIYSQLRDQVSALSFSAPVAFVYNPLEYAGESHDLYLRKYGSKTVEVLFLGMNPGPFGMAQTGVPFGEIDSVRNWLGIEADVKIPNAVHPKRPITGFQCGRSEVSGRRLWGWAKERFVRPERFFDRFFVTNYCPLVFMEESGRNRTPDKLPKRERERLFSVCDIALRDVVTALEPRYVIGVGRFAEKRAADALKGMDLKIATISHPSPANPKANRGWAELIEEELDEIGVSL